MSNKSIPTLPRWALILARIRSTSALRLSGNRYDFPIWVANHYGLKVLPVRFVRPWPVAIITLKNRTSSPVVKRFIECARDVTKLRMLNRPAPD